MDSLSSTAQSQLEQYCQLLCQENSKYNLTAIREPEEIRIRHFEDSLRVLNAADFAGKRVLDVGSGAGFPGLVLAIARPDLRMTVLEATGKKVDFMQMVCQQLALSNVTCLQGRAEELGHDPAYRESFDIVLSRGVTALPALCELCLPFVTLRGWMLAMKQDIESFPAASLFGGRGNFPYVYTLSGEITHTVIRIQKQARTLTRFPRPWPQIKQGPPVL